MRVPRDAFAVLDDGECTITPLVGSPYTAPYMRVPPSDGAPHIEADGVVSDTSPRFSFWLEDLPDGPLKLGETFVIASGPDSGTYFIDHVDALDGETVQVVTSTR